MSATSNLKNVLTRQALRQLAGAKSFERGEDYFAGGQVGDLVEHGDKLTATVQGTEDYQITLSADGKDLDYDCTCPMGEDGAFCKHCVAVGLAWLAEGPGKSPAKKAAAKVVTMDDACAWLKQQDKEKLVELLLDQAATDKNLREYLLLQSVKTAGQETKVASFRQAIDRSTNTRGFVDYRAAHDFSLGIDRVVDSITDLLKEGQAAEVIELAEYALKKVEAALSQVDDSNGSMGGILNSLQELHLKACRQAKPDPEKLAERLFEWEIKGDWDTFYGAAETYAEVLGKTGLSAYRRFGEEAWAGIPQIGPGEKDPEEFGQSRRIGQIMETLARQSGDIEALVAVKARKLAHAYTFLIIAEIYQEAKQHDKALEWAERGVKAFPERTDARLLEFLADEYHRRKRHDEAMQVIWTIFTDHPQLREYQVIERHAGRIDQWPTWREKALAYIRDEIRQEKREAAQKRRGHWGWDSYQPDHSLLVEIFLWEKDVAAAWREAQTGGCHQSWWMELARLREKDFPADAIPIYQKNVEALINQKSNGSYAEAVKLLRKIRDLMLRLQQGDKFTSYLAGVRVTHKPKRNFIKLAERL